ncbi:hypothetical protein CQY20_01455 [Mycolicibacterium agri]|uniref:DUF1468 domain-containing protein n=1 Tax=Mycolicibacterium agri TaxID=36811 RepID=A0A2A7NGY1_MYCAG|nr:tripartite tricarboxylate transporter TctB family protein [Mycolicibacterium agri]PEG42691.1 hypothetical protein CQY20_01455 [Mycolicibacterium agri]GFG52669.1 hypothetical protein MAGR_41100 [Mycolicibacterium agri]
MRRSVSAWLPGAIVTALGVGFFVGGLSYGLAHDGRMAPGLMPALTGLGMIVFGLLLVVSELRSSRATGTAAAVPAEVTERTPIRVGGSDATDAAVEKPSDNMESDIADREERHRLRPWFILAAMVGSLVLAPYIGLIPALALGAFVMMKFVEREPWIASIAVSVLILIASWYVFDDFLEVNLPWGVFAGVM